MGRRLVGRKCCRRAVVGTIVDGVARNCGMAVVGSIEAAMFGAGRNVAVRIEAERAAVVVATSEDWRRRWRVHSRRMLR